MKMQKKKFFIISSIMFFLLFCVSSCTQNEPTESSVYSPTPKVVPASIPTQTEKSLSPITTPQINSTPTIITATSEAVSTISPTGTPTPTIWERDPRELTDDEFLELISYRAFQFFWNEANPENGLIKDRANNFNEDNFDVSSIASVGFGLSALCVGVENEWVTYQDALERAETTLRFFDEDMPHEHGFYYHFVDINTGDRVWNSEVSSIDTALFLAGALTVAQCFPNTEADKLANAIYERVDFTWMLTDGGTLPDSLLLNHGWKPEEGFLPYRWDRYSELMILYILAIGSPTYPIPIESWEAWERPVIYYDGYTTFEQGPLFTHQYSQAWIDFRNKEDSLGFNYFDSSIGATLANRQFAIDHQFSNRKDNDGQTYCQTYEENIWGLTAGDGPNGYTAYSAPPGAIIHDCTVNPSAPAGSIVFTPQESTEALRIMYDKYGDHIWGKYGFSDAFNVDRGWWDQEVIGIDLGITILMIENHRNQIIWGKFITHPAISNAVSKINLMQKEI